jgi:hypothetical protein
MEHNWQTKAEIAPQRIDDAEVTAPDKPKPIWVYVFGDDEDEEADDVTTCNDG